MIADLDNKILILEKYEGIKNKIVEDPEIAIIEVKSLLNDPDAKDILRLGDVYSFLFEYYYGVEKWSDAWDLMEEMRKNGFNVTRYLDLAYMEKVSKEVGKQLEHSNDKKGGGEFAPWENDGNSNDGNGDDGIDEDIEEDIGEEMEEEFQFA